MAQHYDAVGVEDKDGLWAAVKSNPLGFGGPQAHFLIALPINQEISPRAWAFSAIGPKARLYPLKHTNFPDASICAFTKESDAWSFEDGITALVDHYSLWAAKSLHRAAFGWWPGRQIGIGAKYRRNEFVGEEFCGCESGKLYSACHQGADLLTQEAVAAAEFKRLFATAYENRQAPPGIIAAARSRWLKVPGIRQVYSLRRGLNEPTFS